MVLIFADGDSMVEINMKLSGIDLISASLDTLLVESAQLRTRPSAAPRSLGGVRLLLRGDGGLSDSSNAVPIAKHTDSEAIQNKYVLFSVDAILLVIAIWMHNVSRPTHWTGGISVSYALVGLGCVVGYVDIETQPQKQ